MTLACSIMVEQSTYKNRKYLESHFTRHDMTTHPIHMFSTSSGSKHGEDACATPHIKHHFTLKQVLIVVHGITVGQSPHLILQHLLMNTWKGVWSDSGALQQGRDGPTVGCEL